MYLKSLLFISVSTNLPPTAYIKMIDCWLIFSLLKPFTDIIVQTYQQTLREDSQQAGLSSSMSRTVPRSCYGSNLLP